ncbi:hypothetical protein MbovMil_02815 [Mycoplasmopsis bovis]
MPILDIDTFPLSLSINWRYSLDEYWLPSYVSQFKHKTRKHNYVNFWFHKLCFFIM